MPETTPDRIERDRWYDAPVERVWAAVADAEAFGAWSGMRFDAAFTDQTWIGARLVPAGAPEATGDEGVPVRWFVDRLEPPRRFVFRWHPFPVDHAHDYSDEPMATVTLDLAEEAGGTRLSVVEAGYDGIPEERRAAAYRGNSDGWDLQLGHLETYLRG